MQRKTPSAEERIAAAVVAYQPDESFYARLPLIAAGVQALAIVNNGGLDLGRVSMSFPQVTILGDGRNVGVAAALNRGARWARSTGFDWLLTLDQDSAPAENSWSAMLRTATDAFAPAELAVVSCRYSVDGTLENSSTFTEDYACADSRSSARAKRVWLTMTSGNLINLAAHAELGGYQEALFIDHVDHEYCLRANRRGYVICEVQDQVLRHSVGKLHSWRLFGRTVSITRHSPLRMRYQVRNLLYLLSAQGTVSYRCSFKLTAQLAARIAKLLIVLPMPECGRLVAAVMHGARDYLRGRKGRIDL